MISILRTLTFIFFFAAATAFAAPRVIEVKQANSAIKLDGKLDEKAWESIPFADNFTTFNGAPAAEKTKFKVLQDKFGLYLGFEVEDKVIKSEKRVNGPVWFDDSIEILLAPVENFSSDRNIREYFHYIFNADGSIFQNRSCGGIFSDWHTSWQAASQRTANGWTAEVYLPFFPFADSSADNWRFNIGRGHYESSKKRALHSIWSPAPGFHHTDFFAQLKNVKFDRNFYKPAITNLEIKQQQLCGKLEQANNRKLNLTVEFYQQKELKHKLQKNDLNSGDIAIPLKLTSGKWEVVTILKDGKNIVNIQTRGLVFSDSPVEVKVISPAYRNTVYPDDKLEFACQVKFVTKLSQAAFSLQNAQGKVLQSKVLKNDGTLSFDLRELPAGKYKVIGPKQDIPLTIVKSKNYVKLDSRQRCIVNGKLFYPRGFMGFSKKSIPLLHKHNYNIAQSYTLHRQSMQEITAMLDYAAKHDVMLIISPFYQKNRKPVKNLRKLNQADIKEFVSIVSQHPAFFGWYLFDEPRGQAYINTLKMFYELLKEWDPAHPVIGVDNSAGNCLNLLDHSDILSLDMYPSPNVKNKLDLPISRVVYSCQTVAKEKVKGAFWYTPQAFSRESYPAPGHFVRPRGLNIPEIRSSVYGSIAAGANGFFPFKIGDQDLPIGSSDRNAGIFNSAEMRKGYLDILGRELKDLESVLLGEALTVKGSGCYIRGWKCRNADWILLVNPELTQQTATLEYPKTLYRWQDGKTIYQPGKKITLDPYGVLWLVNNKNLR